MISYSAIKQGNKLVDITKVVIQMFATETANEFKIKVLGDYFYFTNGTNKALYETIKKIDNDSIVELNNDESIINAFVSAINFNLKEITIDEEIPEPIVSEIKEKVIYQPIYQPIQTQGGEVPIIWQEFTTEPTFEEIITPAEEWVVKNIAQPIIAKGVRVYNDNIPYDKERPREYVVMSVDDEIHDINFADNRNYNEESLVTLIIQGHGNTFENYVVEVSNYIHELLRDFREKGKVRSITNRNIGFDDTTQILSRTMTFWLQY